MKSSSKKNYPQSLDAAFDQVCLEMAEIFAKKHHDYGKGNILANKELGIAMRVSEKVERLKYLLMTSKDPENETIEENWQDIAVYAVIAVMYKRGWFQELEMGKKASN